MKGLMLFLSLATVAHGIVVPARCQSLADVFEEVSPSVVVIGTLQNRQLGGGLENKVSESGLGSGVLVSEDGLIWTAAHVVHLAEEVLIKFHDGLVLEGKVISSDPTSDLAMIQAIGSVSGKTVADIGDSDSVRIGDDIFVIGAPRGLEYSLSKGIVSGRMRHKNPTFGGADIEFLQVDAAINPGNSGGPVFNMAGEVVGIASFILSESGGFEGIGFAGASNVAKQVLFEENRVFGGMEGIHVSGPLADALNVPGKGGFLIVNMTSKGLGAQLGLRAGTIKATIEEVDLFLGGDIILRICGISCHDDAGALEIRSAVAKLPPGSVVEIAYLRAGEVRTTKFTL